MTTKDAGPKLRVTTPIATLSYPNLFVPRAFEEGQPEFYSAVLVFSPDAQESAEFKAMKVAAKAALVKKFGDKTEALLRSGKLSIPFREDSEEKGYPKGSVWVNAKTKNPPGVVSRRADPFTNKPAVISAQSQVPGDPDELYAGCLVRASITFFPYDKMGNKGVGVALNNIQKWDDGTRIDNRMAAQDEFEADLSETPPSMDDLGL